MRFRAEFIYPIEKLLVRESALGRFVEVAFDGRTFELALPAEEAPDEPRPTAPPFSRFEPRFDYPFPEGATELFASGGGGRSSEPDPIVDVDLVRLSVTFEIDQEQVIGKRPIDVIALVSGEASEKFSQLFDVFRSTYGQSWLGLTGMRHETISWRLINLSSKLTYPRPGLAGESLWVVEPERVITRESLQAALETSSPISLGEALLADALYFQWSHFPQAIPGAVLLAAVACEVRVKEVIRATAGDRIDAAELLMEKPRDFSVAARALFSEVMQAVNGRSLKADDEGLEKRVGKLFETRNGIAHKGVIPTLQVARSCASTATEALAWLGNVLEGTEWTPQESR